MSDPLPGARVVAVADRSGVRHAPAGIDLERALGDKTADGRLVGEDVEGGPAVTDLVDAGGLDVLVDLTPTDLTTGQPALGLHRACAEADVAVVTANKGPLAVDGPTLRAAFARRGVAYRAEATVGGGVPVLSTLRRVEATDQILSIKAVPNASTSRVLDRIADGQGLAAAVDEARRAGVLEADPRLDLTGRDAAAKAAILAQAALGRDATIDDVDAEGILGVDEEEVRWATRTGLRFRLVATVTRDRLAVQPIALDADHALAGGGFGNAYLVDLEDGGRLALAGPGAGPEATACAVRRDLVDVVRGPVGEAGGSDGIDATPRPAPPARVPRG